MNISFVRDKLPYPEICGTKGLRPIKNGVIEGLFVEWWLVRGRSELGVKSIKLFSDEPVWLTTGADEETDEKKLL